MVDGLRPIGKNPVQEVVARAPEARREEEPDPVPHNRTAERKVEILEVVQIGRHRETSRPQVGIGVLAPQMLVGVGDDGLAGEAVASLFGNHVDGDPTALRLRRAGDDLVHHVLNGTLVVIEAGDVSGAERAGDVHAVDLDGEVGRQPSVRDNRPLPHLRPSSDIEPTGQLGPEGGDGRGDALIAPPRRQHVDLLLAEDGAALRALDVDERRSAGHRDGLLERADPQLRVDRGREVRLQDDVLAHERAEARQREGDLVGAGPEVLDSIAPAPVRDAGAHLLDQGGAGRFNRDTGQHPAGRVGHEPGDGALREADRRE